MVEDPEQGTQLLGRSISPEAKTPQYVPYRDQNTVSLLQFNLRILYIIIFFRSGNRRMRAFRYRRNIYNFLIVTVCAHVH